MFGQRRLLGDDQLRDYAMLLRTKSEEELVEEARRQIYSAGFFPVHSRHDQKATQCWQEAERRERPWLYQRGYNSALHDAGQKVESLDLERASEEYHRKEAA